MNNRRKKPQRKKPETRKVTRLSHAKVDRLTERRIGNQAAYDRQLSYELCDDLAGKFAQRSGEGRINYGLIAKELLRLRSIANGQKTCSLVSLLRNNYETDSLLRSFLKTWDRHIYAYISARIYSDDYPLEVRGCVLDEDLMRPLAQEYMRDRKTLMHFLSAAFKRWREIRKPDSLFRLRLLTQQLASLYGPNRKRILDRLQKIGAISTNLTTKQQESFLKRIGQYLSRDQVTAVAAGFGPGARPNLSSFKGLLHRPSEFAVEKKCLSAR
jgi:hypothetical protein